MANRFPVSAFPKLSIFLRKSGFPKLRGKAGYLRALCPTMLAPWKKHMNTKIKPHRQIEILLDLNVRLDNIFDEFSPSNGYYALPQEQAEQVISIQQSFGQVYVMLKDHFDEEGVKLLNIVSKLHLSHAFVSGFRRPSPIHGMVLEGRGFHAGCQPADWLLRSRPWRRGCIDCGH